MSSRRFAYKEKEYAHTWRWVSLLSLDVIEPHKTKNFLLFCYHNCNYLCEVAWKRTSACIYLWSSTVCTYYSRKDSQINTQVSKVLFILFKQSSICMIPDYYFDINSRKPNYLKSSICYNGHSLLPISYVYSKCKGESILYSVCKKIC